MLKIQKALAATMGEQLKIGKYSQYLPFVIVNIL